MGPVGQPRLNWSDVTGIPSDIADGDNDTQLSEAQLEHLVTSTAALIWRARLNRWQR